jgi:hypothetical protein
MKKTRLRRSLSHENDARQRSSTAIGSGASPSSITCSCRLAIRRVVRACALCAIRITAEARGAI